MGGVDIDPAKVGKSLADLTGVARLGNAKVFNSLDALFAAAGILVAAAFTLRVVQVSFFGRTTPAAPRAPADDHPFAPISWPEKAGAALLLASTLLIGLRPDLLLNWITPALQSPLMQAALKGGRP